MTISRFCEICLIFIIVIFFPLLLEWPQYNFGNLKPVGNNGLVNIIKGVQPEVTPFIGLQTLFAIFPDVENKKKIMKPILISIIITTLIYIVWFICMVAFLGIERIKMFTWADLEFIESISFPILDNLSTVFIITLFFLVITALLTFFYTATTGINVLIGKRKKKDLQSPIIVGIICFASFSVVFQLELMGKLYALASILTIIFVFIIPLLLLVVSVVFKRRKSSA
jgi:hypothetical protein